MAIERTPDVPPFVSYCAQLIPTVFDNSLSYYEALSALAKWMQDNLVEVVNNNAAVTEQYIQMTEDLKDFVDNYFDNLDVQEEINNKLDALVADGTLSDLLLPVVQNYLEPVLNEQNEQIADLNTRLVNQNNYIDSVNARVDGIASLTEGSTTGDAELMDIRVGYDGVTYDSAGDAVRHGDRTNAECIYEPSYMDFAQQSINASTGADTGSNYRIHTQVIDNNIYKVSANSGYKLAVYLWNKDTDEYVGVWNGAEIVTSLQFIKGTVYLYDLQKLYKIKILGAKDPDNLTINNVSDANNFIFYTALPIKNKKDIEYLKGTSYSDYTPKFVQGSIDVHSGQETSRTDRCRSVVLPEYTTAITPIDGYRYMLYGYDADGEFLGAYNPNTDSYANTTFVFTDSLDLTSITGYGLNKYRIIACPQNNVPTITPDEANNNIKVSVNVIKDNKLVCDRFVNNFTETIREQTSCVVEHYESLSKDVDTGICMVSHNGNYELWTFTISNDDGSNFGACDKYSYDPATGSLTFIEEIQHNLGHVNSVSYCEETDTLICGNGSGDYDLAGAIYLIEGAYSKGSLLRSDAIVIPFTDYGFKVNAVWGDPNFDQHDIVYVITNDSHDIYKIQLGKFSNDLGNGTIISGATQFNATYQVLNHWTWGSIKEDYPSVVQGATFCSNKLVWGYGHNMGRISFRYAKLNTDNTAEFGGINYRGYSHAGVPSSYYPCGVSTFKDKLVSVSSRTFNLIDLNASI